MIKAITPEQLKKLPPGTPVYLVNDSTGERGSLVLVKSGRKKMLRGVIAMHEIKDMPGLHYEVEK